MESRTAPQSEKTAEENPCLPEQLIMEEILTRLPVKSLLKFRCVSKPWCTLIGSKRFIKAHLKYSIKSSWIAQQWIFSYYLDNEFKQCYLPFLFYKPFTAPISDLGIQKSDVILPVGYCNGLVCVFVNWSGFILWNPATKKFINLPDLYCQLQINCIYRKFGFGFDELSDDYKVFGIDYSNLKDPGSPLIGMIYSLRSNSWKLIEDSYHFFPNNQESIDIQVSGKLHWKSYKGEIVSFDLNSHVFKLVELPSYTKGALHSVAVIWGCLSAHFVHPNGDLDVWIMKEYGVKESWDKVVTIPYSDLEILTPTPNGKVLLIHCSTVGINYNPKCGVHRHPLQIIAFGDGFGSNVRSLGIYVESLVSINPDA